MKEPRFIELLNLYVDQQLSPQEAAELEAEIQQNPAPHRTYRQYCRMQKACAQLFEHERSSAPASTALSRAMADADRKIIAFPDREAKRSLWPVGFSIGAVAAAACVAFVVVRQNDPVSPAVRGSSVAAVETAPAIKEEAPLMAVATAMDSKAMASETFTSVFTVPALRDPADREGGLFVSNTGESPVFDWAQEVQFKPLRKVATDELAFDQRAGTAKPVTMPRTATSRDDHSVEMVTFEFTK